MFRLTSDYIVSAKSMAVFLLAASAQTMCITTALEVQSSAAYGYHGTVSKFYLSKISNKDRLYSSSDFSTLFDFEVNASRHVYSPWCT